MKPSIPAYLATATGKRFHFLAPRPEDICIEDIATGLSRVSRYNGQYKTEFQENIYSVAQHSVYACQTLLKMGESRAAFWGLMHDAAEAYLGDIPTPLKQFLPEFHEIELGAQKAIINRFNVRFDNEISTSVDHIDRVILHAEVSVIGSLGMEEFGLVGEPPIPMDVIDRDFQLWTPEMARSRFLNLFHDVKNIRT